MCVRVIKWPRHAAHHTTPRQGCACVYVSVCVCVCVCTFIAVIHLRSKTLMVIKTLERIVRAKTKPKPPIGFSRAEKKKKCQSAELIMAHVKIRWARSRLGGSGGCAVRGVRQLLVEWRNPGDIHSDFVLAVVCHLLDLTDAWTHGWHRGHGQPAFGQLMWLAA